MTESDLKSIEMAISVRLPKEYRDAVCPFPVRAFIGNTDTDFWDDAAAIIELNRRVRQRDKEWPPQLFAIGDRDSATTAIDLNSPALTMWWIDRSFTAPGTGPDPHGFVEWSSEMLRQLRSGEFMDGFDPENDPPGTRDMPMSSLQCSGCVGITVGMGIMLGIVVSIIRAMLG